MPLILLVLGILIAGAGIGAVVFSVLVDEFRLLLSTSAIALVGGLTLVALGAIIGELKHLGEVLRPRSAGSARSSDDVQEPRGALGSAIPPVSDYSARMQVPGVSHQRAEAARRAFTTVEPPAQPNYSVVDVSAAAIQRLRSIIPRIDPATSERSVPGKADEFPLSPSGQEEHREHPGPAETAMVEAKLEDAIGGDHAPVIGKPRTSPLDFLFGPRPTSNETFDSMWDVDMRTVTRVPDLERMLKKSDGTSAKSASAAAGPLNEWATVAILKSGVVSGMAYSLYADGAIEVALPWETVKFQSITELSAYIENNSLPDGRRRTLEEEGTSRVLPPGA